MRQARDVVTIGATWPAAMTQNPPSKHHFSPVFHLTEWTGADGELEQFHRPWGPEVQVRRLPPAACGHGVSEGPVCDAGPAGASGSAGRDPVR